MQRAEQLAPITWCCAMKSAARMGRDNRQRNVTVISFAFRKSTILSSLLPKNQRSSLIYFQKKNSSPRNQRSYLFLLPKKPGILSHFPSKKQHPLSFYLKEQHPQKSAILSIFTSKKTASSLFVLPKKISGGYDNQGFYFKKSSILKISDPFSFYFQKTTFSLLLLPKKQRWVW